MIGNRSAIYKLKHRLLWLVIASSISLPACSTAAKEGAVEYAFHNPPTLGSSIRPQPMMVACNTIDQALAMSASGLFVTGCERATDTFYLVQKRSLLSLREGDVWIIETSSASGNRFIPFPWHNWA